MNYSRKPLQQISTHQLNSLPNNYQSKAAGGIKSFLSQNQFEFHPIEQKDDHNYIPNHSANPSSIINEIDSQYFASKVPQRVCLNPAPQAKPKEPIRYQTNLSSSSNSSSCFEEMELFHKSKFIEVNGEPYLAVQQIGKGGSSKVYKVINSNGHIFALKIVKLANANQETVESFINEIHLLHMLQGSERIINLVDSQIDRDRKKISIVLELGDIDLRSLIDKNSCDQVVNPHFLRYIWQQMLEAVQVVHNAHVVHGDLKPANFLFVKGTLKLIDFGIAKTIDSANTTNIERTSTAGTLNYMSPEALMRNMERGTYKCGRAADVWSLGCILYQLVYNRPPFPQTDMLMKMKDITDPNYQIEFEYLEGRADFVYLYDVMYQCLQRDPKKRPTIENLLSHPFITQIDTMVEEQIAGKLLPFINFIQDSDYCVNQNPMLDKSIMIDFAISMIDREQNADDVTRLVKKIYMSSM